MATRKKVWHDEIFVASKGIRHRAVAEDAGAVGATHEIDFDDGLVHQLTLDENLTLTFANEPDDTEVAEAVIVFTQDGTGGNTVTWPSNVDWAGGTAPTITSAANAKSVVRLVKLPGDNWLGTSELNIS